jgi:quercetin dioxygenase-like cupin family protein
MNAKPVWKFVSFEETVVEELPGRTHFWHCRPDLAKDTNLLMVRVKMLPGEAHRFHRHPRMEEILYILSGTAEQWVDKEKRILKPGDSVYLAADIVHGTYNIGADTLDFLAILSPAQSEGPATVDVFDEEPWKSLRG